MDPDVERAFEALATPLVPVMRRIHEVILNADPRMTAYVKHVHVHFAFKGDMAAFVQPRDPKRVSLMFFRGAKLAGDFPHLEGDGPTARFMRFTDLAEVEARADELAAVTRAWCDFRAT